MEEVIQEIDPLVLTIIGVVLPLLISVVIQPSWSANVKALVALAICVAVGVGVAWWEDLWFKDGVVFCIVAVYGIAQISHHALWNPTGVDPAIESTVFSGSSKPAA